MKPITLILDLDGVLITTPLWKKDEMHADGYSDFNEECVRNLNLLLAKYSVKIYLSSTRRTVKTLEEFNTIFRKRNISQDIEAFLPLYQCKNRKEEIERFIVATALTNYIIIDDDKSTVNLPFLMKERLIKTEYAEGFTKEKLAETIQLIEKLRSNQ
ncbi:HAD domain-containing protein [Flavobacterium sp.]|uniref:HAD domain-containing protein n=1 Tax=Flavobacterium sp. TaxID=239 RepID=UPI0040484A0E